MSFLIFCSFEVGGLPYKMAETLNRHGVETYYVSLARDAQGHDSTRFHYGNDTKNWDLSSLFDAGWRTFGKDVKIFEHIKRRYGIIYCLATGHKAYLLKKAGIRYGYWCYGLDFDQCFKTPDFSEARTLWKKGIVYLSFLLNFCKEQRRFAPARRFFWDKIIVHSYILFIFCREQRRSVLDADSLMILTYQKKAYEKSCPDKRLFFVPHLINVTEYEDLCDKKYENKIRVCKEINAENFFFSSARHLWFGKNRFVADSKWNDVILFSLEAYLKISGDNKSKLIIAKKGPDVERTRNLAHSLKLDDYVVWVDEMRRDELLVYYQGASLCFGQFGTPALNYAVLEPLANASPCVSFAINSDIDYHIMPPIFNSRDPQRIGDFMHKIISDKEYASYLSYESWCWAKENCSEEVFVKGVQRLCQARRG